MSNSEGKHGGTNWSAVPSRNVNTDKNDIHVLFAFCVFVYVIVYNYVNICTSHNNKPFTYCTLIQRDTVEIVRQRV